MQNIQQGETVLASGDGHQNTIRLRKHVLFFNSAHDLLGDEVREAGSAKGGMVARNAKHGFIRAFTAAH